MNSEFRTNIITFTKEAQKSNNIWMIIQLLKLELETGRSGFDVARYKLAARYI